MQGKFAFLATLTSFKARIQLIFDDNREKMSQLRKVLHLASFGYLATLKGRVHIYTCTMPYIDIKFVCIAHGQTKTKMATATDEDEETATLVPRSTAGSEVRAS